MPRSVYYQSSTNPIQPARLPQRAVETVLPHRDQRGLNLFSSWTSFLSLVSLAVLAGWYCRAGLATWGFRVCVFTGLAVAFIYWTFLGFPLRRWRERLMCLPLVGVAWLLAMFQPTILSSGLAAAVALSALTWLFGNHYVSLRTTAPMPVVQALHLRHAWRGALGVVALWPTAWFLLEQQVGIPGLALFSYAAFLCQTVLSFGRSQARPALAAMWDAWRSWATYNARGCQRPGLWESPAGGCVARLSWTCFVAFLVTASGPTYRQASAIDHPYLDSPRRAVAPANVSGTRRMASPLDVLAVAGHWLGASPCMLPLSVALAWRVILQSYLRQPRLRGPARWKAIVDCLRRSRNPIERSSVYVAEVVDDGAPLYVPIDVYGEHAHFLGDSGAGKTSLGLAPTMEQLATVRPASFVVIDLKADTPELFSTLMAVRQEQQRRTGLSMPLRHFTTARGLSTYAFNPLSQAYWHKLDLYQKTDVLCGALGLTYGPDYGAAYYGSANAAVLYQTLKEFPDVTSLRELSERVAYFVAHAPRGKLHPDIRSAGIHVQMVLDRLASYPALNVDASRADSAELLRQGINMADFFQQPQLAYFSLSATLSPASAPEIARLVTYSLLCAATTTRRKCQVYLVIDEFQRMVAQNVEYMLQLARSMGVGIILANQSMADLCRGSVDLISAIEANCRFRQWFSASTSDDRERLVQNSGETVETFISTSNNGERQSLNISEQIRPRFSQNEILLAGDHPFHSIVTISRGAGYAQFGGMPVIVRGQYHISRDEYTRRKRMPWPAPGDGAFIPHDLDGPAGPPPPSPPAPGPDITVNGIGPVLKQLEFGEYSSENQLRDFDAIRRRLQGGRGRRRGNRDE